MQGGQPDPGRGVYVARRIVVAMVLVLLLVLLVPRACEALLPKEESSSRAPEIAATDEDPAAEQASITDSEPSDDEIDAEGDTGVTTSSAEAGGDESVEALSSEIAVDLPEVFTSLEPIVGGADIAASDVGIDQTAPIPGVDDQQQVLQPVVQPPPVQPVVQPPPVQPVTQQAVAQPVPSEEPGFFGEEPFFFEGAAFFQEPFFFQEPVFFGEALVLEENADSIVNPSIPEDTGVVAGSDGAIAVTATVAAIS